MYYFFRFYIERYFVKFGTLVSKISYKAAIGISCAVILNYIYLATRNANMKQ